jgi:hypothetical protein
VGGADFATCAILGDGGCSHAADVFQTRFGDCKDKTTLFVAWPATWVWWRTPCS